jgi:hypothetical protein
MIWNGQVVTGRFSSTEYLSLLPGALELNRTKKPISTSTSNDSSGNQASNQLYYGEYLVTTETYNKLFLNVGIGESEMERTSTNHLAKPTHLVNLI